MAHDDDPSFVGTYGVDVTNFGTSSVGPNLYTPTITTTSGTWHMPQVQWQTTSSGATYASASAVLNT